eukprot:TRINITY_DN1605_c0_g1_i2.p1 TRINITY_DN1605_c0_g1~~TRINITY_DN1605_c0_g1_i2.p1  ORF type:complete len:353 (+),score=93.61 TRINITY_DN1605_c0_g1_i2:76-1134(+)
MGNKLFWICFSALFFFIAARILATDFAGPGWQSRNASDKLSVLWSRLTQNTSPGSFPSPLKLLELFVESMDTSFDTIADDLPYQGPFNLQRRSKLIHGVGVHATFKWRNTGNHPYTGLFQSGSNYGIARLSWAKAVDLKAGTPWLPGVAFKFLRNGRKSANFMAMTSLLGVNTPNFFANDVTNHVPDLGTSADFITKKLRSTFAKASDWPVLLGLSDVATYDENGVQADSPVFPYRLIFHAPASVRSVLETDDKPTDMPSFILSHSVFQKPVTAVWSVWAEAFPQDPNPIKIAEVDFTSPLTTSDFGDKYLFFQHQRMEDDISLRPDWFAPANQELANQRSVPNYLYPNRQE